MAKEAISNHKTTREPNQDDFKTVLIPAKGPEHRYPRTLGSHLGSQIGTKTEPKTMQKRSENSRVEQKTIQDDLGPVLGRSWAVLGAILGRFGPQNHALALGGARFF